MARRRGPGPGSMAASRRTSSPPPSSSSRPASHSAPPPRAAPPPVANRGSMHSGPQTAAKPQAAPAAPAAPAAAPAVAPGGGFMSNVASTAAGVMGAHAIMGMFRGGDNNNAVGGQGGEPIAPGFSGERSARSDRCQTQFQSFFDCLAKNENNIGACQADYDSMNYCQRESQWD